MTPENSAHSRTNLPAILGAAAVPFFVILILGLNWILPSGSVFEPPWLLPVLNTLFISCISLVVATLAARSFLVSGSWNLVLMGCGMLAFGLAAAINGWLSGLPGGTNINITIYNLGVFVGSIFHLASAAATYRGAYSPATRRPRRRQVLLAYSAAFLLVVLIVWFAVMHWIPTFFVQGVGATAVRQGVLGTAIALFVLSAVLFGRLYFRTRSRFLVWYALALALIAVGLGAAFIVRMVGGPVSWLARIAQYTGGLYFLFAILAAAQSARQQKAPLDQAMAELFRRPEEHYRAIVETVSDAIISCDAEGRILLWNAAAIHSFGFSRQEAIGARLIDLIVPEENLPQMREAMAQWSQTGTGPAIEKLLEKTARRKDGSTFPVEISVSCRLVRQLWFTTFVIRDITARKEAALELFQVQQMIRLVLDTVPQRIFWKDRNLRFLGCNRSFAADAGYSDPQQIIGLDDHALSWKEMAGPYQSNDNWVMENDQAKLDFEEPQQREDGTIQWLRTSLVPLHDEAGRVVGVLGTYENITQRKQAEEALRLSDSAVSSAQSPIAILDLAGTLTKVNRAFLEVWGYPDPAEVLGRSVVEFWQTGDQAANVIAQLQKTGGWLGELEARRKDGSQLQVQVSASMITDPEGHTTGMMASFLDITERKRLEEELVTKAEELARSNAELEQFAYVASHDLQEPLRMISSYVQLLARRYQGALGTEADEFIHYAVDGTTRMQALIQDLLAYSRVGGPGTKLVPVDCEKVLRQTLMDMQITITEAGATITHDPLPVIRFDPVQFAQILQNLISNAIKFRRPEVPPIVALAALQRDEEWLFSVKDNGLGVSDLFLKKAFQIFQRWQAGGESLGTGIGLAVCRKIVERFGGRIWVESKVGEGSTFYFTIPLKPRMPIREA